MNYSQKLEEKKYRKEFQEFKYKNPSATEEFYIRYRIRIIERYLPECEETADFIKGELMDGVEIVDGVPTTTKLGTASDFLYWDKELQSLKERLQRLNEPETLQPEAKENPYPLIFVNLDVYDRFIEYTNKIAPTDFYKSYSYLKKRLEAENLIHKQTDTEFMYFIYDKLELITKEQHQQYLRIAQLESAERTKGKGRKINFDNTFNSLCL